MDDETAANWPIYGSDLIVDLLVEHGIDAVAFNPGATFRGIHDSLVQGPHDPRLVLCTHESVAVAVAHGYAKATGRPMAVMLHDVVGLQVGSMAVFNAWCDRVPMLVLGGTGPLSVGERRPWIDWIHTANVQGQVVRDFVKWDDQPADLASVPESLGRAMSTAVSEPPGPVYVCFDTSLQERTIDGDPQLPVTASVGTQAVPSDPAPDPDRVTDIADQLRNATTPVIITDYAGATPRGFELLHQLAAASEAWVIDLGARFNLATNDPHNATGFEAEVLSAADAIVAVDVEDLYGALLGSVAKSTPSGVAVRPGVHISHFTPQHLKLRSWAQDAQRGVPLVHHVTASAASALAALLAELQRDPPAPAILDARRSGQAGRRTRALAAWREEAGATPVDDRGLPPARIAADLEPLLATRRWTVVNGTLDGWERRLWRYEHPGQHLGWHGGGGLGYGLGASIGAAMHLAPEHLCIDLQPDGDLLYTPSAFWTLANQRIPLLVVVLDNGQYGNTVGHAHRIAIDRGRDPERRYVGAGLEDPRTDFVALARSFGVHASGPITSSQDLVDAARDAIEVIEGGAPAVLHVLTPGG